MCSKLVQNLSSLFFVEILLLNFVVHRFHDSHLCFLQLGGTLIVKLCT